MAPVPGSPLCTSQPREPLGDRTPLAQRFPRAFRFREGLQVVLVLLSGVLPSAASAQGLRSLSLSVDNDGLVFWESTRKRTDWYYTHGMKVEATGNWALPGAELLSPDDPTVCAPDPGPDPCILSRITFGQAIYTPKMLFSDDPLIEDRPYVGWLFVDASTALASQEGASSLGVQVGITGGPSLASPLHRWFHTSLGKHEPMGWKHQIPFEVAFSVTYEARRFLSILPVSWPGSLQIEPRGSVSIGTLRTGAMAGISIRAGWNAPSSIDWWGARPGKAYLLLALGSEGEVVVRDLFLDGSTWGRSAHADLEPLIGRLTGRMQVGLGGFGLEIAATRSSIQFRGQEGKHTVGTVRAIIRP